MTHDPSGSGRCEHSWVTCHGVTYCRDCDAQPVENASANELLVSPDATAVCANTRLLNEAAEMSSGGYSCESCGKFGMTEWEKRGHGCAGKPAEQIGVERVACLTEQLTPKQLEQLGERLAVIKLSLNLGKHSPDLGESFATSGRCCGRGYFADGHVCEKQPAESAKGGARFLWIELTEHVQMIGDEDGELQPYGEPYFDVSLNSRMNLVTDRPIPNSLRVVDADAYEQQVQGHVKTLKALEQLKREVERLKLMGTRATYAQLAEENNELRAQLQAARERALQAEEQLKFEQNNQRSLADEWRQRAEKAEAELRAMANEGEAVTLGWDAELTQAQARVRELEGAVKEIKSIAAPDTLEWCLADMALKGRGEGK